MITSIQNFRAAATAHLHLASAAQAAGSGTPAQLFGSAAYLAHVAVESTLKSLLLKQCRSLTTQSLMSEQPRLYKELFSGKSGHDLEKLAVSANVARVLGSDAPKQSDAAWKRMCHPQRPYALRYATEPLTSSTAEEEVALASKLHRDIGSILGRSR